MNDNDFKILANFLAKNYFMKQTKCKTSKEIREELISRLESFNVRFNTNITKITDPKFREIIAYIRDEGLMPQGYELVAYGSNGYMKSDNHKDSLNQIESLEGKARKMLETASKMRGRLKNMKVYPPTFIERINHKLEGDLFDSL